MVGIERRRADETWLLELKYSIEHSRSLVNLSPNLILPQTLILYSSFLHLNKQLAYDT